MTHHPAQARRISLMALIVHPVNYPNHNHPSFNSFSIPLVYFLYLSTVLCLVLPPLVVDPYSVSCFDVFRFYPFLFMHRGLPEHLGHSHSPRVHCVAKQDGALTEWLEMSSSSFDNNAPGECDARDGWPRCLKRTRPPIQNS